MIPSDALISAARSLVGLTEPSPELGQLVDPGGTPEHQGQVERSSLCILAWLGLTEAVLEIPPRPAYVPGSAPRLAEERLGGSPMALGGACRVATLESPPGPGDGIWYGAVPGHAEHVDACVVEVEDARRDHEWDEWAAVLSLQVVAGGQRDARGHETIRELPRELHWRSGRWYCQATGRPVIAVLDAALLGERYPLREEEPATPRTAGD